MFELKAARLANGTKVTLTHFRKVGSDCVDIKLCLVDGKEESTVRDVMVIAGNQAVSSRETNDVGIIFSSEAKHAHDVHKAEEVDTSQTRYGGILTANSQRAESQSSPSIIIY
eukprot:scaffold41481_cov316-Skeletonema_dohrnii-CCMP3373.AAC.1